ncbi:MAG: hypothetical protein WAO95_03290 [Burkholderiales bacterium]
MAGLSVIVFQMALFFIITLLPSLATMTLPSLIFTRLPAASVWAMAPFSSTTILPPSFNSMVCGSAANAALANASRRTGSVSLRLPMFP